MRFYHLCLAAVNFLSCLFFSQIPDFFTYPALFTYSIFSLRSFHRPLVRSGRHILTSSIRKKHYRLHRRCKPDMAAVRFVPPCALDLPCHGKIASGYASQALVRIRCKMQFCKARFFRSDSQDILIVKLPHTAECVMVKGYHIFTGARHFLLIDGSVRL